MILASLAIIIIVLILLLSCGSHLRYRSSRWPAASLSATTSLRYHLHFESTAFNSWPKRWRTLVSLDQRWYARFYDLGAALGVIGLVIAQLLLVWSAWSSCRSLYDVVVGRDKVDVVNLVKRSIDEVLGERLRETSSSSFALRPLLPGINLPLSSFPSLLFALVLAQLFHEFGHALAAQCENVEMISMGVYIYLILPTFYVSLPRSTYEQSTTVKGAISTLRIATAGIYHNLVLCAIVYLLQASGGGMSTRLTGWAYELVDGGISVSHIASASPLHSIMSTSTIITRVNDIELDAVDTPIARWKSYLQHDRARKEDDYDSLGFCLPLASFVPARFDSHDQCCEGKIDHLPYQHPLCFVAISAPSSASSSIIEHSACLSSLSLLPPSTSPAPRCVNNGSCGDRSMVCARIGDFENVLMLGMREVGYEEDRVVVYQGTRQSLLRDVIVSDFQPRFGWIPISSRYHLEQLYSHIQSLSMTIAFFNLLPLPQLDGSAILEAILLLMSLIPSPADSLAQFDLDSLESGSLLISGRNLRHSALLQSFTFVSRWLPTIEINDRRTMEWMRLVGHWTTGMAVILLSSSIAAEAVRLHV